jgi:hypothetical protein
MTELIKAFFPFADYMRCSKCGEPVSTREAIAVVDADQWAGFQHPDGCPGDDE